MPTARLTAEAAAFYTAHSPYSDPGDLAPAYAGLPADPARLARIARDLMIHRLEGELFGHTHPAERLHDDAETRYLDDILRLVLARDAAPLTERRAPGDRFVGVCRDFALLHCSLLRHAGVPARVRSGFADYFGTDGFHGDHVVTEFWSGDRGWLLADAQLTDPLVAGHFGIGFDPMDVPRDRFLVAGAAWREIRAGRADPLRFGLPLPEAPLVGEWFVAGNVRLDLAALNKSETLLWDIWGEGADSDAGMTDAIRTLYDRVAAVTADEVPFTEARTLYENHDGLRTPRTVLSLPPFHAPREVTLR